MERSSALPIISQAVLISLMGGLLGAGLAVLLIDPITAILPAELGAISDIRVNGQVLGFSFLLAFVTGLLAGLSPALRLSRSATQAGVGGVLRTRSKRRGVGNGLVAGQFALATTLLVAAGLLLRSLMALYAVDLGMEIRGLTSLSVTLPIADYPTGPLTINGVQSILRELSAQPGSNGVTAVSQLPLSGAGLTTSVALEGADGQDINSPSASIHVASLGHFETLQIPVLRGRTFDSNDPLGSELVSVWPPPSFWDDGWTPSSLESTQPTWAPTLPWQGS